MKCLVLGIGNVMYADEGVGVHLCNVMARKYRFASDVHHVDFIDGGTLAMGLMHIMVEYDHILILDCIDADKASIGDVFYFDYAVMPKAISWSGSAHEIEMLQTLQMLDLAGDLPKTFILGIVPKRVVPMSFTISDEILPGLNVMEKKAVTHLEDLGFRCEVVNPDLTVRDMANEFELKGRLL